MAAVTARQVARVRKFAQEELPRTAFGRELLELAGAHWREVLRLFATSAPLREASEQAIAAAATVLRSPQGDRRSVIGDDAVAAAERLLGAIEPRASAGLREAMARFRRTLHAARGRSVGDVIGPPTRS